MHTNAYIFAFGLSLLAGLSTVLGSLLVLFTGRSNNRVLSVSLGFSAGVMVYVSFMEILPDARASLMAAYGGSAGQWFTAAAFFGGILFIGIIDKLVPEAENPHETHHPEDQLSSQNLKLLRTGLFTAFTIALHNLPEGMATFAAALKDPMLGIFIAVAIALHNIPEGISVSIPIYHATGSRARAIGYSLLSGLVEPLGALLAFAIFHDLLTPAAFGLLMAFVAGIMVFISFDELFPTARECGQHHLAIYGLLAGMAVMAVSLLLLVK
jgi:ZIP family zinc transporter